MTENNCDMCRLYERLSELTRERDYYREQAIHWASAVERQGLSYAEHVQLDRLIEKGAAG